MKSNSQFSQSAKCSCYENFTLLNYGILVFALTVIIPLSFRLTKLPFTISLPVFVVGFISLFWLARQKDKKRSVPKQVKNKNFQYSQNGYGKNTNLREEEKKEMHDKEFEVPLELVRDHMEETLSRYADYIDDATKKNLISLCKQLEKMN